MSQTIYDSNYIIDPVLQQPLHLAKPLSMVETLKDIVVLELRKYFEVKGKNREFSYIEAPSIEKYKITDGTQNQDAFISSVNVIRQLPDINQKLPILAITTATGHTVSMGIDGQYCGVVQESPRFSTNRGPWNLPVNSQFLFLTKKGQSLIALTSFYVADFTKVQPAEIANAINCQSARIQASVNPDNSTVNIQLKYPDLFSLQNIPVTLFNYVATEGPVTDSFGLITTDHLAPSGVALLGPNADAATILGINGAYDDATNPLRPPKHRYYVAKDFILNIDIGADDDNQRTELTDLLSYFFDMHLQERDFTLLGDPNLGQNWQIVTKKALVLGGESEIPRPEGDGFAKIYVNRISIPITMIDYVDRPAVMAQMPTQGPVSQGAERAKF